MHFNGEAAVKLRYEAYVNDVVLHLRHTSLVAVVEQKTPRGIEDVLA